jgi:hypothetical protein
MSPNLETPATPTLQGILASLLWLTAHPRRRTCLNYQSVVLQQMRYLAELSDADVEPMLRSVAEQLSDEIEDVLHEQLAALRSSEISPENIAQSVRAGSQLPTMITRSRKDASINKQ